MVDEYSVKAAVGFLREERTHQESGSHQGLVRERTYQAGAFIPAAAVRLCLSAGAHGWAEVRQGGPGRLQTAAKLPMDCKYTNKHFLREVNSDGQQNKKNQARIPAPDGHRSAGGDGD